MLQESIEDMELVEKWLTAKRGSRVHLRVPLKGKEKLVDLAARNAALVLSQDRERIHPGGEGQNHWCSEGD